MQLTTFYQLQQSGKKYDRVSIIPYQYRGPDIIILVARGGGNIAAGRFTDLGGRCEDIDANAVECGLREFKEETGITLTASNIPDDSPVMLYQADERYQITRAIIFLYTDDFIPYYRNFVANTEAESLQSVSLHKIINNPDLAIGVLKHHCYLWRRARYTRDEWYGFLPNY